MSAGGLSMPGDAARKLRPAMMRGLAFLGAVLGVLLAAAQSAGAASLPTFVIKGHGWGHGVGMGQDGAYGYAKHGFTYAKILAHYYPGTALTKTTLQQVRVLLADGTKTVSVTSKSAFRVRDADGNSYPLAAGTYNLGPALKLRVESSSALHPWPAAARARPRLPRLDPRLRQEWRASGRQHRRTRGICPGGRLAGGVLGLAGRGLEGAGSREPLVRGRDEEGLRQLRRLCGHAQPGV